MPRPRRSYGRPGTRIIPKNFAATHGRVLEGTYSGACEIFAPSGPADFTVKPDLTVETAGASAIFSGPYRARTLNAQETTDLVGDQEQITSAHLLAITAAADIPVRSIVTFTDVADPALDGIRLTVRRSSKGSHPWERFLWCVEDLTAPRT